jgi:hypothetical protein
MAMISKTAKQPMAGKASAANAAGAPQGGTTRSKFTGTSDSRKTGTPNRNNMMKATEGYINQGPDTMDTSGDARGFVSGGPKSGGNMSGRVTVAKEDVTKGMGGKVIKDMR